MAVFVCRVGSADGQILEKEIQAASQADATSRMRDAGYHVFSVRKRSGFQLLKRRIPTKDFVVFNQEFLALIRAGIPIFNGLTMLQRRTRHVKLKELLGEVVRMVKEGQPLSQAFLSLGEWFPPFYPSVLLAGERSGDLASVLANYIDSERLLLSTKKRMRSAFVYPAFLILVAALSIGIIINVVLPSFSDFYKGFGKELPWLTQAVVSMAGAVRRYVVVEVVGLVLLIGGARMLLRTDRGRRLMETALLRMPLFRDIWRSYILSQFSRTLSILLAGGIPALAALETLAASNTSRVFADHIRTAAKRVSQGENLSRAFRDSLMDDLTLDMIRIGEESGSVTAMLANAADYHDEDLNGLLSGVVSLVAPAVLLVMGVLVAALLVAMYLPLFEVVDIMS